MEKDLIYIRVLQHDGTSDEIRIGNSFPIWNTEIEKAVQNTLAAYEKRTAWCGGFKAACEVHKYYKRIAIVDAETLAVIRTIYPVKQEE